MSTVFDITAYGAVGDGITDCTAAIQAALDDAAKCQGVVSVPSGTFLTGKLQLGARVTLEGHSAWTFRSNGGSIFKLNDPAADCLLEITGAFGCAIRGICFDGGELGEKIHGIHLCWPVYNGGGEEDTPTIDDCRISKFTGDGIHLEHVWCFSVRHSQMAYNGGAGLYIDGWDAFILDNWFSANGHAGILGGRHCSSVTATGNRVEWNRKAGFLLPYSHCCNFTGNYFDRSFGPALALGYGKAESVAISGNIFHRNGRHNEEMTDPQESVHLSIKGGKNIAITGNTMSVWMDDNCKGRPSPDYGTIIENCTGLVMQGNAWMGGALQEGILLKGENTECIVKDNPGGLFEN